MDKRTIRSVTTGTLALFTVLIAGCAADASGPSDETSGAVIVDGSEGQGCTSHDKHAYQSPACHLGMYFDVWTDSCGEDWTERVQAADWACNDPPSDCVETDRHASYVKPHCSLGKYYYDVWRDNCGRDHWERVPEADESCARCFDPNGDHTECGGQG